MSSLEASLKVSSASIRMAFGVEEGACRHWFRAKCHLRFAAAEHNIWTISSTTSRSRWTAESMHHSFEMRFGAKGAVVKCTMQVYQ